MSEHKHSSERFMHCRRCVATGQPEHLVIGLINGELVIRCGNHVDVAAPDYAVVSPMGQIVAKFTPEELKRLMDSLPPCEHCKDRN
jgi:hypothetical protein